MNKKSNLELRRSYAFALQSKKEAADPEGGVEHE